MATRSGSLVDLPYVSGSEYIAAYEAAYTGYGDGGTCPTGSYLVSASASSPISVLLTFSQMMSSSIWLSDVDSYFINGVAPGSATIGSPASTVTLWTSEMLQGATYRVIVGTQVQGSDGYYIEGGPSASATCVGWGEAPDATLILPTGSLGVATGSNVILDFIDEHTGTQFNKIKVKINNVYAFLSGNFTPPYSGTSSTTSAISGGYRVTIDPVTSFTHGQLVDIAAGSTDITGNIAILTEKWRVPTAEEDDTGLAYAMSSSAQVVLSMAPDWWLRSDQMTGGFVPTWVDESGYARNISAATAEFPKISYERSTNGFPLMMFTGSYGGGSGPYMSRSAFLTSSAGELFMVLKRGTTSNNGTHLYMSSEGQDGHFMFSSNVYENFGSTVRRNYANVSASNLHVYNVTVATSSFTARANGNVLFTTASNTVSWTGGVRIAGNSAFSGTIGEIIVWGRNLTDSERSVILTYLRNKWSI